MKKIRNGFALLNSAAPLSSYYYMQAPNEPPVTVTVETPAPEIHEPEEQEAEEEQNEEIKELCSRVDAIDARISELIEGNRTWTQTELNSLKSELADLSATLNQVVPNLTTQIKALEEKLTLSLQELQAEEEAEEIPEVTEITPPTVPENVEGTPQIADVRNAPPNETERRALPQASNKKKRIV